MISEVAKRMMDKMPAATKMYVDKYADLVVRVNRLLKEKGYFDNNIYKKQEGKLSEIDKWLNQTHDFSLHSIAKLEAELGEALLEVPKQ